MPSLACQHKEVLSGEHGAKTKKRKISEYSGRFLLGIFFSAKEKYLAPLLKTVIHIDITLQALNVIAVFKRYSKFFALQPKR